MGCEEVAGTKQSEDKGVDVVTTVQFAITTVTEVVQVKRRLPETLLDREHGLHLLAIRMLAQVRKMGPAVQINIAGKQVNAVS